MSVKVERAVAGRVAGTAVMTAIGLWGAPMMGIPPVNPAALLAGAMGGKLALGWMTHFTIGTILALKYHPGRALARWATRPAACAVCAGPFMVAQAIMMPMEWFFSPRRWEAGGRRDRGSD